ncbi:hypothetical protein INR49_029066 [Caranx melampygus]|nr:hypothetical protein INR49_029066 [Caranx melampygus]
MSITQALKIRDPGGSERVDFLLPLVAGFGNNHNSLDTASNLNATRSDWVLVYGSSKLSVLKQRDILSYAEHQKDASYITVSSRPTTDSEPSARIVKSMSLRAAIAKGQIVRLGESNKTMVPVKPSVFEVNEFFRGLSFKHQRRAALLHVHVQKKMIPQVFRIAAAAPSVNMASALGRLARLSAFTTVRRTPSSSCGPGRAVTPCRTAVCTSSGAILPKPKKVSVANVSHYAGALHRHDLDAHSAFHTPSTRRGGDKPVFGTSRYQARYSSRTLRLASSRSLLKIGLTTLEAAAAVRVAAADAITAAVTLFLDLAVVLPLQLLQRVSVSTLHGCQAAAAGGLRATDTLHTFTTSPSPSHSSSSPSSASLADWLEDRDPADGKELISFSGMRSNSAHFFSISSSIRSLWFEPMPFLDSTASHWLLVFLSSCHWMCSLPCPSPASL